jgi:hypothetical protein
LVRWLPGVVLVALLSAHPSATTCAVPIPAGAVVTPDCTIIVEQVDPGVFRDALNQIWVLIEGFSNAVKVKSLAALDIGGWMR